jgi:hypothetical protein
MGMIERRSGLGLGHEPLAALRIVCQIGRQELDASIILQK